MARLEVRLTVLAAAFAMAFALLLVRAAQVQLAQGAVYARRATRQRTDSVALPAPRGALYDRNGVPLAVTQESFHVGIAPGELLTPDADRSLISRALGIPENQLRRDFRQPWVYYHGTFTSAQVHPLRRIRGVHLLSEFGRFYPDPDLAAALLGRPAADGRPASGIERVFDSLLTGRPGRGVEIRDGRGRVYESPSRRDAFPVAGHDIWLTIDAAVQEIVETVLREAVARYGADGGDVVVLAPHTGEILAAMSLRADGRRTSGVFTSVFEPGSTAKIFAAAALLDLGLVGLSDSVYGEGGRWVLPYRVLEDDHELDFDWMTLEQAIRVSSNIGTVKFASRLEPAERFRFLRAFGFGTPTGVEFPSESRGILKRPENWSGTTATALSIGYEVAVTPLQLALAYAAIANDGVMLRPRLVREIRDAGGSVVYDMRPEPIRRAVSRDVALRLRGMLRSVTAQGGTGATAALSVYEVAGKTGTARVAGPGGYVAGSHIAVFASLFPAEDPQLAMVVKLENPAGTYATLTAAPLTRLMLEQILGAQTGALDRSRLPRRVAPPARVAAPPVRGATRIVVAWPGSGTRPVGGTRVVPEVVGLTLRAALSRVHDAGLRARVDGWGRVTRVDPSSGDSLPPGTIVRLVAQETR